MSFDVGAIGTSLAVGELNRSNPVGRDVAVAVGNGVQIMRGDGSGGFAVGIKVGTAPATDVLIDDFDIDASVDDDFVVWQDDSTNIVGIRQDQSTIPSQFSSPDTLPGTFVGVKRAVSGFIDGAFRPDLLVFDASGTRAYTSNATPGSFSNGVAIPGAGAADEPIGMFDIDKDDDQDVVFVNQGTVKVAYNDGSGTFATLVTIATGAQGRAVGFGTFTGDALPDLMIGTSAGGKLFRQTSARVFAAVPGTIPEVGGNAMQVLDVNGDDTDDVVVDNRIVLQCPGTPVGEVGRFTQVEGFNALQPSVLANITSNTRPDLLRLEGTTLKVRVQ